MNEQQLQEMISQLPPEVIMILLQLPAEVLAVFAQLSPEQKQQLMYQIQGQGQPEPPQDEMGNQALFG